jgi:hypothetical protein
VLDALLFAYADLDGPIRLFPLADAVEMGTHSTHCDFTAR